MGRRPKKPADPGEPLFDSPTARRNPTPNCPQCGGDGWKLGPDGAPVEPAIRCPCTDPVGFGATQEDPNS
ncbi:hypothetical protein A5789_09225 [Nocardia sp. 852002-51101_SCH5132738]|uniref:hypothetical protein n=1 Tax=Nocardia sp. 852002-51101_SCH5132738 TaxID=1834095 RepID=UPI0007E935B3|nr:hypothetical protein [Nocardia sp. 852002-51101_SCH5132738]OBA44462.1 hypothetical protein A5789_09225 [Nocardia sp. 852002-51101_SCH5132738]